MKHPYSPYWFGLGAVVALTVLLAVVIKSPTGAVVAVSTKIFDPLCAIGTIAIGIVCVRPKHLYIALPIFAAALTVIVASIEPMPAKFIALNFIAQAGGVLLLGTIVAMIATAYRRSKTPSK